MSFDISDTLAPNSDQLDAVDLMGGPRTFTITKVSKGNAEQPVQVHLAEFPRVWRPGKSMRRVLAACWGPDASEWVGRRVTLYCDESVKFGSETVGGTRISHLSHIGKAKKIPLLVSRGRSATFTVQPLGDDQPVRTAPNRLNANNIGPTEVVDLPGHEAVLKDIADGTKGADDMISRPQMSQLTALFTERGLTERDAKLTYASDVIGRPLTTSTDLTAAEATDLINALEKDK